MFLSNMLKHILRGPPGEITLVRAPVSSGLGRISGHGSWVHAAHGHAAVNVGADLIRQVHVEVGQVQHLAFIGISLWKWGFNKPNKLGVVETFFNYSPMVVWEAWNLAWRRLDDRWRWHSCRLNQRDTLCHKLISSFWNVRILDNFLTSRKCLPRVRIFHQEPVSKMCHQLHLDCVSGCNLTEAKMLNKNRF